MSEVVGNPFEGIESLFVADLDPVRHDFRIQGRECYVEITPMDAGADARFQGRLLTAGNELQRLRTGEEIRNPGLFDDLQIELLLGSVADFQLVRRKREKGGGGFAWELTPPGRTLQPPDRRNVFSSLQKRVRRVLVNLACEANGLDPLLLGPDLTQGSSEPSPSLSANTETSSAASEGAVPSAIG